MSEKKTIPDLLLERYLLGELPRDQMRDIEEKLERDGAAREALEVLKGSNRGILQQYTVEEEAGAIERKLHLRNVEERLKREQRPIAVFKKYPLLVPAAVLAAVLVFTLVPYVSTTLLPRESVVEDTRLKGLEPRLQVFVKRDSASVQLRDGDLVKEGDVLQLRYISAGKRFGMIFSLDGRDGFTLHFPEQPGLPIELSREGKTSLGYSYELDDAPGFERFYFITADKPFDTRQIVQAVEDLLAARGSKGPAALKLPGGLDQKTVTLKKDQP